MEADQMQSRTGNQRGESLHEFQRVIEAHLWTTLARRYTQVFEEIATDASIGEAPKLDKLARRGRLADT
jgi:hypothetical protein